MNPYLPVWNPSLAATAAVVAAVFISGAFLPRLQNPRTKWILGWALTVTGVATVHFLTIPQASGVRMLALIFVLLLGMKALVHIADTNTGRTPLLIHRYFAFALLWLGMRPSVFRDRADAAFDGRARHLAIVGGVNLAVGLTLILVLSKAELPRPYALIVSLSLAIHFGLLTLCAAFWKYLGYPVRALFRNPLRSRGLTDFWSRRWNLGYVEMTAALVLRPLERAGKLGFLAVPLAFLFSGILHEIAISLPVRGGYGLPTLYFALHGLCVVAEKRVPSLFTRHPVLTKLFAAILLTAPLPILFHEGFRDGIVLPIIGIY